MRREPPGGSVMSAAIPEGLRPDRYQHVGFNTIVRRVFQGRRWQSTNAVSTASEGALEVHRTINLMPRCHATQQGAFLTTIDGKRFKDFAPASPHSGFVREPVSVFSLLLFVSSLQRRS